MIEAIDLARSQVYIANVDQVPAARATATRSPTRSRRASRSCSSRSSIIQPKVIVALGQVRRADAAAYAPTPISKLRGRVLRLPRREAGADLPPRVPAAQSRLQARGVGGPEEGRAPSSAAPDRRRPAGAVRTMPRFVSVAVPVPALDALTYALPDGADVGTRCARARAGREPGSLTGCVLDVSETLPPGVDATKVKPVSEVVDAEPLPARGRGRSRPVDCRLLPLRDGRCDRRGDAAVLVDRERARLQDAAGRCRPDPWIRGWPSAGRCRDASSTTARPNCEPSSSRSSPRGSPWAARPCSLAWRSAACRATKRVAPWRRSSARGAVDAVRALRGQATRFKTAAFLLPTTPVLEAGAVEAGTAKQAAALELLRANPGGLALTDLAADGVSRAVAGALVKRGLAAVVQRRIERDPFEGAAALQDEGREAAKARVDADRRTGERTGAPGGTGRCRSVSRRAASRRHREREDRGVPAAGASACARPVAVSSCSCPRSRSHRPWPPRCATRSASASPSSTRRCRRASGTTSGTASGAATSTSWSGTRSAVFAPLGSLGLVIVDEEHDTSYKQDETPRYHGRDVAIVRAQRAGALVVLGSATPSLESFQNARAGRYALVSLTRRVMDRPLATVTLVNMRDEYAAEGPGRGREPRAARRRSASGSRAANRRSCCSTAAATPPPCCAARAATRWSARTAACR